MPLLARSLLALGLLLTGTAGAWADAKVLNVAKQYGLGYLQFMVMEDGKLIEKRAREAGLDEVDVKWATFRSSDVMNDALISGSLDFACLGFPGLATIWSRTRGNIDVRAAAGLNLLPLILTARDPAIKTIRDFKENQKIAVPAIKVSIQAIVLEMAAAREWGPDQYGRLDPLTVSLAHPDATAQMLGGKTEIVANFSSPPFQYRQLKDPAIHRVLTSDQVIGGPYSFNVVASTDRFRKESPKLYRAFLDALQDATDAINRDKPAAAELYLRLSGDKTPKAEILAMMEQPDVHFTTEIVNGGVFTDFMGKVGAIKVVPKDWRTEMVFPDAKVRP